MSLQGTMELIRMRQQSAMGAPLAATYSRV
jgi:hypothetical protein